MAGLRLGLRLGLGGGVAAGGGGGATAPAQFAGGDWSVSDAQTGGAITITVAALPADGGSALTDIEYQIDGGAWVSLGAAALDDYPVSGLANGVEVTVALRAVNAIGAGVASAGKTVTPAAVPSQFAGGDWSVANAGTGGAITITVASLPASNGSALTDLEYRIDAGSWVSLGDTATGSYPVSGLANDVQVSVTLRAVNAIGAGTASAGKNVTPSVVDPYFANVVLLVGFNGADGSTSFTDDSTAAHALTAVGNAQVDTAQSVFGGAAVLLDGNGDYVSVPDSADWDLSDANSDQFTIEFRMRFADITVTRGLIGQYGATNNLAWRSYVVGSTKNVIFDFYPTGASASQVSVTATSTGIVANTWYAVAIEKDSSGKIRIYIDGVMKASATPADSTIFNSSDVLAVGAWGSSATATSMMNGWIDELRITKGVARYASDGGYTVATAAFPRG